MDIIVLQHIKVEDPGYIKDLMLKDGVNLTTIELDEGEKIPEDLSKFDAMFCMGGPMDTWMEDKYPWLIEEKQKIKDFVINLKKPYLGFCLGCQLLGEVVGGRLAKSLTSCTFLRRAGSPYFNIFSVGLAVTVGDFIIIIVCWSSNI